MGKTGITVNELLEDLAKEYLYEDLKPGEVTAQMLAEQAGISIKRALYRLDAGVEKGELTKRKALFNGRKVSAYERKKENGSN